MCFQCAHFAGVDARVNSICMCMSTGVRGLGLHLCTHATTDCFKECEENKCSFFCVAVVLTRLLIL